MSGVGDLPRPRLPTPSLLHCPPTPLEKTKAIHLKFASARGAAAVRTAVVAGPGGSDGAESFFVPGRIESRFQCPWKSLHRDQMRRLDLASVGQPPARRRSWWDHG